MYFSPVFRAVFVKIPEIAMLHLTGNCVHLPGKCLHHVYIYSKIAYIYLQIKENTLLHTCVCAYVCARIYAHAHTHEGIKTPPKETTSLGGVKENSDAGPKNIIQQLPVGFVYRFKVFLDIQLCNA